MFPRIPSVLDFVNKESRYSTRPFFSARVSKYLVLEAGGPRSGCKHDQVLEMALFFQDSGSLSLYIATALFQILKQKYLTYPLPSVSLILTSKLSVNTISSTFKIHPNSDHLWYPLRSSWCKPIIIFHVYYSNKPPNWSSCVYFFPLHFSLKIAPQKFCM